jgi:hypothetical protein
MPGAGKSRSTSSTSIRTTIMPAAARWAARAASRPSGSITCACSSGRARTLARAGCTPLGKTISTATSSSAPSCRPRRKRPRCLLVAKLKNLKANLGLDDGDEQRRLRQPGDEAGQLAGRDQIGTEDSIEVIESAIGRPLLDPFVTILDHDTAGGVGLSYYTLTGRMDKSNYTAIRGALLAEDGHIRPLQNWFARRVALPMRREFQRQAIGLGKLKSVSASQFLKNERSYSRFDAVGAGRDCWIRKPRTTRHWANCGAA